jgi:hypothetical protein
MYWFRRVIVTAVILFEAACKLSPTSGHVVRDGAAGG